MTRVPLCVTTFWLHPYFLAFHHDGMIRAVMMAKMRSKWRKEAGLCMRGHPGEEAREEVQWDGYRTRGCFFQV